MATASFQCPSCGSNLRYQASSGKMHCEYCKSTFDPAEIAGEVLTTEEEAKDFAADDSEKSDDYQLKDSLESEEEKQAKAEANREYAATTHGYHCDNCGAEVVTESQTSSAFCYYCHSPVVFSDKVQGNYRPDKIIPFEIGKEDAQKRFLKWTENYGFLPRDFSSPSHLEKMTGIYLPFWLAKASADIDIVGFGETSTSQIIGDNKRVTVQRHQFSKKGKVEIDDIKTLAIDRLDSELIYSVESSSKDLRVDFNPAYLAGYFSERFTIPRKDVEASTKQRITSAVESMIARSIGMYSKIQFLENRRDAQIDAWEYVLLPFWILTYNFQGKIYIYALNGQSGEFFGELPIDKKPFINRLLLIAAGLLGLGILGGAFLW